MPLITGITTAGILGYIEFHGLLANATKSLQGSAFQQANIKLAQAIAKLSPQLQMKALGFTSAQVQAWQQQQAQQQTQQQTQQYGVGSTIGSQLVKQTSKGCLITEVFT